MHTYYLISLLLISLQTVLATRDVDFWINPCGFEKEPLNKDCGIGSVVDMPLIKTTLQHCLIDVNKAVKDGENLQLFLKKRHSSFDVTGSYDDINAFRFLKVSGEYESCNVSSSVPVEYNLIQRHSVALEQMMADAKHDKEYFEYLNEKKRSMINLLCSLYELMLHLDVRRMADVRKDIMPAELRKNERSVIIMRDIIVTEFYIDRMKSLEHIIQEMKLTYSRFLFCY